MIDKPTRRWRAKIAADDVFTEESVSETERVLDAFQERLRSAKNPTRQDILSEIQRVILELNMLDGDKYPGLIYTLEREELCDFIESVAKTAGLQIADGEDITLQWRTW